MKSVFIPSNDFVNKLHVVIWEPKMPAKGIVQISHGMEEHILRYEDFACYLNKQGYLVIGNDHLGHGRTAKEEDLGYFGKGDSSRIVVDDLHSVTEYAKKEYPGLPVVLFGHSMGSFLARRYLMTYGNELSAAIICGSGTTPLPALWAGKAMAAGFSKLHGDHYRSPLMNKMAFGSYHKRIEQVRTDYDWLSVDPDNVDRYIEDPLCGFGFTVNGYCGLFDTLLFIQKQKNIEGIPKDLPLFLIAGKEDPVGNYGVGVKNVYRRYKKAGIHPVYIKLYDGVRHEILNEAVKEDVYRDVRKFLGLTVGKNRNS